MPAGGAGLSAQSEGGAGGRQEDHFKRRRLPGEDRFIPVALKNQGIEGDGTP